MSESKPTSTVRGVTHDGNRSGSRPWRVRFKSETLARFDTQEKAELFMHNWMIITCGTGRDTWNEGHKNCASDSSCQQETELAVAA